MSAPQAGRTPSGGSLPSWRPPSPRRCAMHCAACTRRPHERKKGATRRPSMRGRRIRRWQRVGDAASSSRPRPGRGARAANVKGFGRAGLAAIEGGRVAQTGGVPDVADRQIAGIAMAVMRAHPRRTAQLRVVECGDQGAEVGPGAPVGGGRGVEAELRRRRAARIRPFGARGRPDPFQAAVRNDDVRRRRCAEVCAGLSLETLGGTARLHACRRRGACQCQRRGSSESRNV